LGEALQQVFDNNGVRLFPVGIYHVDGVSHPSGFGRSRDSDAQSCGGDDVPVFLVSVGANRLGTVVRDAHVVLLKLEVFAFDKPARGANAAIADMRLGNLWAGAVSWVHAPTF